MLGDQELREHGDLRPDGVARQMPAHVLWRLLKELEARHLIIIRGDKITPLLAKCRYDDGQVHEFTDMVTNLVAIGKKRNATPFETRIYRDIVDGCISHAGMVASTSLKNQLAWLKLDMFLHSHLHSILSTEVRMPTDSVMHC